MIYLLDTDSCIHAMKNASARLVRRITSTKPAQIAVSSITLAELEYGCARSQRPQQDRDNLLIFLRPFEIIDFDQDAAEHYGVIRACLETEGKPLGAMDLRLAAQARSRGLVVVTNNAIHFERVPGLAVETWCGGEKQARIRAAASSLPARIMPVGPTFGSHHRSHRIARRSVQQTARRGRT